MKITCNLESFQKAFALAAGASPLKTPLPVLGDVLLRADESGVTLTGTDRELAFVMTVPGAVVEEPGVARLPGQKCRAAIDKATAETIAVEEVDRVVRLSAGLSEQEFPTGNPAEFPEPPGFSAGHYHAVEARDLRRLIRRTIYATDSVNTRWALGGVNVERRDGEAMFAATNGKQIATQRAACEAVGEPGWDGQVILQEKALKLLERHLDDGDPPVHMAFDERFAMFRAGSAVIWSRVLEGRFPSWRRALWEGPTATAWARAGELRRAIEQAAIVTDEITKSVWFRLGAGTLRLDSAASTGKSRSACPVRFEGSPIDLRLDPPLLVAPLKALGDDAEVMVEIKNDRECVRFTTDDGFLLLITPIGDPGV